MSQSYFKSYDEVLDFIFKQLPIYQRQGPKALKYDLSNITALMEAIGNPHKSFPSIHIAGTNGKGSTAHLIAAALQANSLRTGLYTSPHYKDYRERIKIDGNFIPKKDVLAFFNDHIHLIKQLKPSYFELSVAMAFKYFAMEKVDIAVIEVGLGGRLDSTNIITPLLSVITNISLDHTQTLGDTLVQIAKEKAGIIKKGVPVIIGDRHKETEHLFRRIAKENEAAIYFSDNYEASFDPSFKDNPLEGPFAKLNKTYAACALAVFSKHYPDFGLEPAKTRQGMERANELTNYIGRWHIINRDPIIIADGAHNTDGWKHILRQIEKIHHKQLIMVMGFVFDKSYPSILEMLPKNATYLFCKAAIPRALDPETLKNEAEELGLKGSVYLSVKSALEKAKDIADKDDLIFISGSIFIVGEIL